MTRRRPEHDDPVAPRRHHAQMSDSVDILIRGGTIVDGNGAPGRSGSVAVVGNRIRGLEADDATPHAGRVVDAAGKVVAPGFIDLHSHGGLVILADPHHEPKVRQGVTTELVGVDGLGYAPFANPDDLAALREMNAGLDGDPGGVTFDWSTIAGYLDRLAGRSLNVATLVGNTPIRIGAIGWDDEPATPKTEAAMRSLVPEGVEEGGVGGRTRLHYT